MNIKRYYQSLLSAKDMSEYLNVSHSYFINILIKDKQFPRYVLSKNVIRYNIEEVLAYLKVKTEKSYAKKLQDEY